MFFLSPLFTVCTYGCGIPWRHRILNSGLENGCEQKWRRRRGRKKQTNEHSTDTVSTILMVELHLSLCQNGQFSIYLTHLRLFFSFFSVALQCSASPIFLFAASMFHRFMNFLKIHKHTKDFLFGFILFASPALCDLWLTLPKIICTDTCSLYYSHNSRGPFL